MIDELATIADSAVKILTPDNGQGSGTVIAHLGVNSYILTCHHVTQSNKRVLVTYRTDKLHQVFGIVERSDEESDLALIRTVKRIPVPPLKIATVAPERYERLYGVAHPSGSDEVGFEGVFCSEDKEAGLFNYTGLAVPGMSGGTLTNDDCEIVGVIESVHRSGHLLVWPVGHAVSLERVKKFLGEASAKKARKLAKAARIRSSKHRSLKL